MRSLTPPAWSTFRPITGFVTSGFELRSRSRDETGWRSNRFAMFAMNERISSLFTVARSASVVPGCTVSAFATADSTGTDSAEQARRDDDLRGLEAQRHRTVEGVGHGLRGGRPEASPPIATPRERDAVPGRAGRSRSSSSSVAVVVVVVLVVVSRRPARVGAAPAPRRARRRAGTRRRGRGASRRYGGYPRERSVDRR